MSRARLENKNFKIMKISKFGPGVLESERVRQCDMRQGGLCRERGWKIKISK